MSPRPPLRALPTEALLRRPVHVVVRDYPEALAVLQRHGVAVTARGAEPLGDVAPADPGALIRDLESALSWRPR